MTGTGSGLPAELPIQVSERHEPMLTATIIFTVLVAAWGNSAAIAERIGTRLHHPRGGRSAAGRLH
jgi:hypothetical protein